MKDLLLILDQGDWFSASKTAPLVDAARTIGFRSLVVSRNDRFRNREDERLIHDFNDPAALEKSLRPIRHQVAGVLSTNDLLTEIAGYLNDEWGCAGPTRSAARLCSDKYRLSCALQSWGLPVLPFERLSSLEDFERSRLEGSIIVKPTQATGGVSNRPWDYQRFPDVKAFRSWLLDHGHMTTYLEKMRVDSSIFCQEFVESDLSPDVHVNFLMNRLKIFLEAEVTTGNGPKDYHIVRSQGAVRYPERIRRTIHDTLERIRMQGFRNHTANAQFVCKDGKPYLIDFNCRAAGVWTYLHRLMMPDFFENSLREFFLREDGETDWRWNFPHYVKMPFYLESGRVIREIRLPEHDSKRVLIGYADKLVPGYRVPEFQHSIAPSPQIFAVGDSIPECESLIRNVLASTHVRYEPN